MELTYDQNSNITVIIVIAGSTIGYAMKLGIYKISDLISMLKSLLPNEVRVKITIDDIRLKSNLTTKESLKFTKKSFSYTILGFTRSNSGLLK